MRDPVETTAEGIVGIAVELAVDDEVLDVLVEESRLYDRVRAEIIFGREIDIPGMIGHQRGVAEFAVALIIIAFLDEEARRDGAEIGAHDALGRAEAQHDVARGLVPQRSEEHTSELQSLMRS